MIPNCIVPIIKQEEGICAGVDMFLLVETGDFPGVIKSPKKENYLSMLENVAYILGYN